MSLLVACSIYFSVLISNNHYSLDVGTDLPNYDKPAVPTKQPRFGGFHDDDYSDAGSSDNEER